MRFIPILFALGYSLASHNSIAGDFAVDCFERALAHPADGGLGLNQGTKVELCRDARDETIAWLLKYNRTRLHSTLANVSPMQFEQDWFAAQAKQANS